MSRKTHLPPCVAALLAALVVATALLRVPATAVAVPSVAAYRGLGGWIDLYDGRAFDNPEYAVADMYNRGARTIYVETSNSSRSYAIIRPADMSRLIRAAHAKGMKVVAWYLPYLAYPNADYDRVAQAIRFRTADGQRFDSFALDIESSKVSDVTERNRRLLDLSIRIRRLVGTSYPLGAIIPSPVGIRRSAAYWPGFPYAQLAKLYDVWVPMSYYTYHGNGETAAYQDTIMNVDILRAQGTLTASKPIHLIGGLAEDSDTLEVRAFAAAARRKRVLGSSLYEWSTMRDYHWRQQLDVLRSPVSWSSYVTAPRPSALVVARNAPFTVTGYLSPRHALGVYSVAVDYYQLVRGAWTLRKRVWAINSAYNVYFSKYSQTAVLPYAGTWKIAAAHRDALHDLVPSWPAYVTVR